MAILAVDNNSHNLEFIRYLFTARGYKVVTAETVTEGLKLLNQESAFDLIVSDLNLPNRTGLDFLKTVKSDPALQDIPFFIISASSRSEQDAVQARQLGACNFIYRPIEPQKLLDEIEPYLLRAYGKERRKN